LLFYTLSGTGGASGNPVIFSVASGPGTISGDTLTINGAGKVVVAANQAGNTDYAAAPQVTQAITIKRASQSISFTAPKSPVSYGSAPITLSATGGESGNAVVFSIVSGPGTISGATLKITGAGTIKVLASQAGNGNYSAAPSVGHSVQVNKAELTVTAKNASRKYGAANPTFTYGIAGFVDGDTASKALAGAPALTTSASATSPVGTYPISVKIGTLAATNYRFKFVAGTLTVTSLGTAAKPTFTPGQGKVAAGQKVTLKDAATGAVIRYTTDGTTPTDQSTKYTVPITVSKAETIKAIAIAPGYADSAVASASYAIK